MSLFDENYRYTEEARALSASISDALRPVLKHAFEAGHSPREVEYIASKAVTRACLGRIITSQAPQMKEGGGQ